MWGILEKFTGLFKKETAGTEKPKIRQQGDLESKFPLMRRIINAFESGSIFNDYTSQFVYNDADGNLPQLTLGFGITSSGTMVGLIQNYIKANGKFAEQFKPFIPLIRQSSIVKNTEFRQLLKRAGKEDVIFRNEMDKIFHEKYFAPALEFFNREGFTLPLSLMVWVDTYIHSGSVSNQLRQRFSEKTPKNGGNEKRFIIQYLQVREQWLANHSRKILNGTAVRPRTYLREANRGNWDLDILPINCNGVKVS